LAFNAAFALHLVGRRRLGRNARLRLLFKDGAIPSVTIILRTIFATSILVNGLYTPVLESSFERTSFFNDVPVAFKNFIKAHFPFSSLGAERQFVHDIEKDIVDTIVGDMMFNPKD
jgi:hypothetical protein